MEETVFCVGLRQKCTSYILRTLGGQCAWTGVNRRVIANRMEE